MKTCNLEALAKGGGLLVPKPILCLLIKCLHFQDDFRFCLFQCKKHFNVNPQNLASSVTIFVSVLVLSVFVTKEAHSNNPGQFRFALLWG